MARKTALEALERCRRSGAWSSQTISSLIDRKGLDSKDAAFCTRLFLGTLQNLYYLDFLIDSYAKGKLEPKIRDILRLGAYQIVFMDKVPDSAAVNESVSLCKACGYSRVSGLVNAVLRKLASNPLPEIGSKGSAESLSIRWSNPLPLVKELIKLRGYEAAEAVLKANNEAAATYIQTNTLKTTTKSLAEMLYAEKHPFVPGCLVLSAAASLTERNEFQDGLFFVQDPAARMAVSMAGAKPGMRVLDACSAPGGKSFAAAMDMNGEGEIISCDISAAKLYLVAESAERLGIDIINCQVHDAREPFDGQFDLVIADVPCSGLGVIRKKPEIRYKDYSDFDALKPLQTAILNNLSAAVKPGGKLAYSTCTWRVQENAEITQAFIQTQSNFEILEERTFWPDLDGTDGFYICLMRRKNVI